MPNTYEIICIGLAVFDISMMVESFPQPNDKVFALDGHFSGGGPAANAAYISAKLGAQSVLMGYLGWDDFGQAHIKELEEAGVITKYCIRGADPTPLSNVWITPDGQRTIVTSNQRQSTLLPFEVNIPKATVFLADGHEPETTKQAMKRYPTSTFILDAGSLREETLQLAPLCTYLICSEKFAKEYTKTDNMKLALDKLKALNSSTIITLGEKGLIYSVDGLEGALGVYPSTIKDTTGSGDAFHGAFAYGLVKGFSLEDNLKFSSAVGALTCRGYGGRQKAPSLEEVQELMQRNELNIEKLTDRRTEY